MKTCDEMLNSLYERRAQYVTAQRKKKKVLASAGATLCAVSLLGGSVWYLNRPQHDIPVVPATDDGTVTTTVAAPTEGENTTTTNVTTTTTIDTTTVGGVVNPTTTTVTTVAPTTAPSKTEPPKTTTTTVKNKLVITADEPEFFSNDNPNAPLKDQGPISPALQEKMEQYKGVDVVYSVIVEILCSSEELDVIEQLPNTNDELKRLEEERTIAYDAYIEAKEQAGGWYTQEVNEKRETFRTLASQYMRLHDNLIDEYSFQYLNQRVKELADWSKEALISLTTDTRYEAIRGYDRNYAFFMELTAEEINDLADCDGYFIRLVFPGGDKIEDTPC